MVWVWPNSMSHVCTRDSIGTSSVLTLGNPSSKLGTTGKFFISPGQRISQSQKSQGRGMQILWIFKNFSRIPRKILEIFLMLIRASNPLNNFFSSTVCTQQLTAAIISFSSFLGGTLAEKWIDKQNLACQCGSYNSRAVNSRSAYTVRGFLEYNFLETLVSTAAAVSSRL